MKNLNEYEMLSVNGGKTVYNSTIYCKCKRTFSSGWWDLPGTARIAAANAYSGHIMWTGEHGIVKTIDSTKVI